MNATPQKLNQTLVTIPTLAKPEIALAIPGDVTTNVRTGFEELIDGRIDSAYAGVFGSIELPNLRGWVAIETDANAARYEYLIDVYLSDMGYGGEFSHRAKLQTTDIGELLTELAKFNAILLEKAA